MMTDEDNVPPTVQKSRRGGALKSLWRRIRGPIGRSSVVRSFLVWAISSYLKFVHATNPPLATADNTDEAVKGHLPFIVTFWHGQHLMGPFICPKGIEMVAMFSRSADAELNARVAEKLGLLTVRGSGGRGTRAKPEKGGARALLTLKNALKQGQSAAMIADIAHGAAREAGVGIILLAKLSGCPIYPTAYAFSRRHVLERSWDKTTIPLPFGRSMVVSKGPLYVPADADEAMMEEKRIELTRRLNEATAEAYAALEQAR